LASGFSIISEDDDENTVKQLYVYSAFYVSVIV